MKKILLFSALLSMTMFGCGGGTSGSTVTLQSVYLTSSPDSDRLEADVLNGNSCSGSISTGGTPTTETIPISVTSTAYRNRQPSPILNLHPIYA